MQLGRCAPLEGSTFLIKAPVSHLPEIFLSPPIVFFCSYNFSVVTRTFFSSPHINFFHKNPKEMTPVRHAHHDDAFPSGCSFLLLGGEQRDTDGSCGDGCATASTHDFYNQSSATSGWNFVPADVLLAAPKSHSLLFVILPHHPIPDSLALLATASAAMW